LQIKYGIVKIFPQNVTQVQQLVSGKSDGATKKKWGRSEGEKRILDNSENESHSFISIRGNKSFNPLLENYYKSHP
jgi:hypothetical protein